MRALLVLAALGGGAYYLHRNGQLQPILDQLGIPPGLFDFMGEGGEQDQENPPLPAPDPVPEPAADKTPHKPQAVADFQLGSIGNEYELLTANIDVVSPWAAENLIWTACLMEQESGGRVNIRGPKTKYGYAYGSMQVLLTTAQEIYRDGFTMFQPTADVLLTEKGGIYFGTAYLEMLSRRGRDLEWMAKAYHGGPGGEGTAMWGPKTENYAKTINAKYQKVMRSV